MDDAEPSDRLAIVTVGELTVNEDGLVVGDGWLFHSDAVTPGETWVIPAGVGVDGATAGWTIPELHAISHGVPCRYQCPIANIAPRNQ